MIKHVWSVICSKSSIDKNTNNVSLFEILEQLTFVVGGPDLEKVKEAARNGHVVVPFSFEVVTLWERGEIKADLDAEARIAIIDPKGKQLQNIDHKFTFEPGKRRMRVYGKIEAMPVNESGIYHVVVSLKEKDSDDFKPVAELPLEVKVTFN